MFYNKKNKPILFISPPFGNYIHLSGITPIRGSFTLNKRPGKWMQIIKTLRYNYVLKGWVNKIGLRNPGIDYAIKTYKKGEIISIAILDEKEIESLEKKIPKDMDIELNVSCPNTEKHMINKGLKIFLNPKRKWCIIKLPPIGIYNNLDRYYNEGFRQFHVSNTIPIKEGGLSGQQLKPFTSKHIQYINKFYKGCTIIAGGGIRTIEDIEEYKSYGADHFSISSLCFNPVSFIFLYMKYKNIY
jgi:dihydroorotate dehydrogenase